MKKLLLMAMAFCLIANPVMAISYPVEMRVSDDLRTLEKVYELDIDAQPTGISKSSFILNGYHYSFVDFICEEVKDEETYWAIEPVEFYSKTNDVNSIINQLEKEIEVNYENGFSGRIPLNLSSIQVKSLGTGKSTKNVSKTQTYPNLSSADMSHIPKTLDGMTLTNVQWRTDNTQTIDYIALTDRYSCVATYGGTSTSTYSKGYTVTADYQGELKKEVVSKARWTAMFSGTKQFNYWWLSLGAIPLGGAAYLFLKKGRKENEKDYLN